MRRIVVALTLLLIPLAAAPAMAQVISGVVRDEAAQPLANVDLDFILLATGDSISVSGDFTDAAGAYSVTVPPGVYDVLFSPAPGNRLAGHAARDVNLTVNQLLNVVLRNAWFVRGQVLRSDTGLGMERVDLDFKDLITGNKIFTPRDNTDLLGRYEVAVPTGIYEVTFDGPEPDLVNDPWFTHGRIEEMSIDATGASASRSLTGCFAKATSGGNALSLDTKNMIVTRSGRFSRMALVAGESV